MKLLVICPTRERPKEFLKMYNSFASTRLRGDTTMFAYIDEQDPKVDKYKEIKEDLLNTATFHIDSMLFGPRKTIIEVMNSISRNWRKDFTHFMFGADDLFYVTPGWDNALCEAAGDDGISFAEDFFDNRKFRLPANPVIGGKLIDAMGYMAYPELRHLFIDNFWYEIGKSIGKLNFVPEVVIEHKHAMNKKAKWDNTYRHIYDARLAKQDEQLYLNWFNQERIEDVERIKGCLSGSMSIA